MDSMQRRVIGAIRESIATGLIRGSKVSSLENPHAVTELIEQNQEFLNEETNKLVEKLNGIFRIT